MDNNNNNHNHNHNNNDSEVSAAVSQAVAQIAVVNDAVSCLVADEAQSLALITRHSTQLCLEIWRRRALKQQAHATGALLRMVDRSAYDCGMVSEHLMGQLLKLDGVGVGLGDAVRASRKEVVLRIKKYMRAFDALRARALRLLAVFKPRLDSLEVARPTETLDTEENNVDTGDDEVQQHTLSVDTNDEDMLEDEEDEEEEEQEPAQEKPSQLPSQLRYHPRFQERAMQGGVLISAQLQGVAAADCEVVANSDKRTLTVKGIRRVRSWSGEDWRWFEEEFSVPSALDMSAGKVQYQVTDGQLHIFLRRVPLAIPRKARAHQRPAYMSPHSYAAHGHPHRSAFHSGFSPLMAW